MLLSELPLHQEVKGAQWFHTPFQTLQILIEEVVDVQDEFPAGQLSAQSSGCQCVGVEIPESQ